MKNIIIAIILLALVVALVISAVIPLIQQMDTAGQKSFDTVKKTGDNIVP
jgi:hypothetical protein